MRASPFLLSKTRLFTSYRQTVFAFTFLFLIFLFSLFLHYLEFRELTRFDDYYTKVWVEKQYKKHDYWVLRLHSVEGFSFYTSSKEDLKELEGHYIFMRLFTQRLDFISYLRGFYVPSQMLSLLPELQSRYVMMQTLEERHSSLTASVYNALYFAGPIPLSIREQLSGLGINHLLAISGFHLGVLSFVLFWILKRVYQPFQAALFPFRNANRDIGVFVLTAMCAYLYFLDLSPSLLRAFSMSLFAYILYDRGVKIISFSSLLLVVFFLLAFWPKLIFSLGFWFSVAGVFYIFLFLHHAKNLKAWQSFILLHFWVYLAMLPLVHYFYGSFSYHQLLSPLLTMLFIPFYPLSLLLHLIGSGELLDPVLEQILGFEISVREFFISGYLFLLYLFCSLMAVFYRLFFYIVLFFSLSLLSYFLYGIAEF